MNMYRCRSDYLPRANNRSACSRELKSVSALQREDRRPGNAGEIRPISLAFDASSKRRAASSSCCRISSAETRTLSSSAIERSISKFGRVSTTGVWCGSFSDYPRLCLSCQNRGREKESRGRNEKLQSLVILNRKSSKFSLCWFWGTGIKLSVLGLSVKIRISAHVTPAAT